MTNPADTSAVQQEYVGLPLIYTRTTGVERVKFLGRATALGLACVVLGVLITAARLSPSKAGTGTHQQLGLSSCAFMQQTGLPCPSCGFTTAFTHFAHGNLLASFYVQPMGALLAVTFAAGVWIGFYIAITGRPILRLLNLLPSRYYIMPPLVFGLIAWGWKIVLIRTGHDGW